MLKNEFIHLHLPLAREEREAFRINPVVILTQAAIETSWGVSVLALEHNNFFGITAYSRKNVWWQGDVAQLSADSLSFHAYPDPQSSFMDYARLLRAAYPRAANASDTPPPLPARLLIANTSAKSTATTAKSTDETEVTLSALGAILSLLSDPQRPTSGYTSANVA